MIKRDFIRTGDAYENAYLYGTFHFRNYQGEQEFVVNNVTFKCNIGEFTKGEKLDQVLLFSNISDDGSCIELLITEPGRGDRISRLCVAQKSVL